MAEMILPGTYITVRDEGLISAGSVATGYIGIVGTASAGPVNQVKILGSFTEARQLYGESDAWRGGDQNELTLVRSLELIYNNGGRTVYAVRVASPDARKAALPLTDDAGTRLVTLEAKTEGTWGNEIAVSIGDVAVTTAAADGTTTTTSQKQVQITRGTTQETYTVASIADFVSKVKKSSTLVTATAARNLADNAVLQNTTDDKGESTARQLSGGANGENAVADDYEEGLAKLENEIVNIVLLAGQDSSRGDMRTALDGHLKRTAEIRRERIGLIGSNGNDNLDQIAAHPFNSDRLIFVAPGLRASVTDTKTRTTTEIKLPGSYLAAAVAGLIASLPVQTSPTNKTLTIEGLTTEFTSSQLEKLVQSRVLAVEKRQGFRVVKGITTSDNSAWHQITTRRIVDYAIYGVRLACNPYIGKLNNDRVRGAMKATLDAFLTRMVNDEALVGYAVDVSATRAQQIAGEAIVTMTIQPTFSIDFIKVTMYLG